MAAFDRIKDRLSALVGAGYTAHRLSNLALAEVDGRWGDLSVDDISQLAACLRERQSATNFSPDGKFVAVASVDNTTKPSDSPLFHDKGQLRMLAVSGKNLKTVAEGTVGRWSQGIAFSRDGRVVMIESMIWRATEPSTWRLWDRLGCRQPRSGASTWRQSSG
jgi:hypothetical protein